MDLEKYRQRRQLLQEKTPKTRSLCIRCLQPEFGCYCTYLKEFDPKIKFAILIHPIEAKRRIATGRMSHLSLTNSELILGQDYSTNKEVNLLLADPRFQPVVLYPGPGSLNLSHATESEKRIFGPKTPLIFVIDGTWATAKKTMHLSQNLKGLPRISFTPPNRSQFRVRKQPGAECFSTIEAIHHTIELLGPAVGFDTSTGQHHGLLEVFNHMVERQLSSLREAYDNPRASAYRRPKNRVA
jgi:DTW domain-containing protein YfiP